MNLEQLKILLADSVVRVTFRKKDGDIRIMDCTKNLQQVPPSAWPKNEKPVAESLDAVRVYDVNAKGWRSFLVDNVISVTPV